MSYRARPEWWCIYDNNVVHLRPFRGGPGEVSPQILDWNLGMFRGKIQFVYSHSVTDSKRVRHIYKRLIVNSPVQPGFVPR